TIRTWPCGGRGASSSSGGWDDIAVETSGGLSRARGARPKRYRRRLTLVAALPRHLNLVAGLVAAHRSAEVVARRDVVVAELEDHVVGLQTSAVGARARRHVPDERPLGHRTTEALAD